MTTGVLLVELVAIGRFTLDQQFPFLHAWLKGRGIPATWLRFALPPDVQLARGEDGIGLDEADLRRLQWHAERRPGQALVLSQPPAPSLQEALSSIAGLRWRLSAPDLGEIVEWLGWPRSEAPDPWGLVPDFGFAPANDAAREMVPTAFVRAGPECQYRRSVLGNPAYEGVDLSGCRTTGCAFCTSGGIADVPAPAGTGTILSQIGAFLATHPLPDRPVRPALRVSGALALREVRSLARELRARDWPPLDLLFDARTDVLVALEADLAGAAGDLAGTGHRLHVCLVGVESFSRAELLRMNKGVEPATNLAAIRVLRSLEARFPGTFRFREHGGLSTILFTPWTSLDDLATNLAVARHFDLDDLLGKLLTSRLRLYPGLPMTALAARDGLLADGYDDPALDTARRNFYPREVPWRFQHPEVEVVNRITTRLQPGEALREDPLQVRVRSFLGNRRPLDAARQAVARSLESPGAGLDELLRPGEGRSPPGPPDGDDGGLRAARLLLALQRAGVSRVNRLESLAPPAAERAAAWLRSERCAVVSACLAAGDSTGGRLVDLFFGPDPSEVREAEALTRLLYSGPPSAEVARARIRLGALLGYPPCCSESFSHATCDRPTLNEWLIVLRRAEIAGPVSPLADPFSPAIPYVPCALGCAATVERASRADEAFRREMRAEAPLPDGHPKLFLLDRPGQHATLRPAGEVGSAFDFLPGPISSPDPRLQALADGGRVLSDGPAIQVERGGRRVASFHLEASIFWHGEAFDSEFWREAALHVLEPVAPASAPPAAVDQPVAPAGSALALRVQALLARGGAPLAGYAVKGVEAAAGRALVRLAPAGAEGPPLEVYVEPLRSASRYYRAAGDLAVTYARRTPITTPAQRRAVEALAARLAEPSP